MSLVLQWLVDWWGDMACPNPRRGSNCNSSECRWSPDGAHFTIYRNLQLLGHTVSHFIPSNYELLAVLHKRLCPSSCAGLLSLHSSASFASPLHSEKELLWDVDASSLCSALEKHFLMTYYEFLMTCYEVQIQMQHIGASICKLNSSCRFFPASNSSFILETSTSSSQETKEIMKKRDTLAPHYGCCPAEASQQSLPRCHPNLSPALAFCRSKVFSEVSPNDLNAATRRLDQSTQMTAMSMDRYGCFATGISDLLL